MIAKNTLKTINGNAVDTPLDPILTNANDISGWFGAGMLINIDWADLWRRGLCRQLCRR